MTTISTVKTVSSGIGLAGGASGWRLDVADELPDGFY